MQTNAALLSRHTQCAPRFKPSRHVMMSLHLHDRPLPLSDVLHFILACLHRAKGYHD